MADSVWEGVLAKLAQYPVGAVQSAIEIYLDRGYAADGKDERYLLGIVRSEAKQLRDPGRTPPTCPPPPEEPPPFEIQPEAEEAWARIADAVIDAEDPQTFDTWYRPAIGAQIHDTELTVLVPNGVIRDRLSKSETLRALAADAGLTLRFVVGVPELEPLARAAAKEALRG